MLVPEFASVWMPGWSDDVKIDPTRMAQGIMTGIGFLGAGVIYKEATTVRGLTTAASIWITSAIGVLMGAGLYMAGFLATGAVLFILAFFPKIERMLPKHSFVHYTVTFSRSLSEDELREMVSKFGFHLGNLNYHALDNHSYQYQMILRTRDHGSTVKFAEFLSKNEMVRSFDLSPTGD
jgi:putative Mg2+ transporter-C (MgtC) family protein